MKSRRSSPEQFLLETIALSPELSERLRDARLVSPVTATGNYSYETDRLSEKNCILLGDAFAFIDPIFSTGVFLAMQSGFLGADAVETCLDHPRRGRRALKAYDTAMRRSLRLFSWFIYRIMTPGLHDIFMNPSNVLHLRDALLSVLAGNVFIRSGLALRLLVLKALYYGFGAGELKASLLAWRKRRRATREPGIETTAT
jgi:flavin-dependent dehydrogenase